MSAFLLFPLSWKLSDFIKEKLLLHCFQTSTRHFFTRKKYLIYPQFLCFPKDERSVTFLHSSLHGAAFGISDENQCYNHCWVVLTPSQDLFSFSDCPACREAGSAQGAGRGHVQDG